MKSPSETKPASENASISTSSGSSHQPNRVNVNDNDTVSQTPVDPPARLEILEDNDGPPCHYLNVDETRAKDDEIDLSKVDNIDEEMGGLRMSSPNLDNINQTTEIVTPPMEVQGQDTIPEQSTEPPMLEAYLVADERFDEPGPTVNHAHTQIVNVVAIQEHPWWKFKFICVGLICLVLGVMGATIGSLVVSNQSEIQSEESSSPQTSPPTVTVSIQEHNRWNFLSASTI